MRIPKSSPLILSVCLSASLLGSCAPRQELPTQTPRLALSRTACQDPEMTPLIPADSASTGDRPVLAGGVVSAGEFTIALWLYCDPALSSDDRLSSSYSEIRYLGFRYEWRYAGLPIQHGSTTTITANGAQMRSTGGGPITGTFDTESSTGNISTPAQNVALAVADNQPVEFKLTVSASDPLASAVLEVTFQSSNEGYYISSVAIHNSDLRSQ